jgi:hypothetical protein
MEAEMDALSASELADLAGVTEAEVDRMVGLGIRCDRRSSAAGTGWPRPPRSLSDRRRGW